MCGIAGWLSVDRDLSAERAIIDAMTDTMSCRGPDDCGTWVRPEVALGHRRLAVIDVAGGRQPMTVQTSTGTVALVYSGEVYNFLELRKELATRGHRFRTDSDTEVVLHGFLEWGEHVAERLNGMFAFAVWDGRDAKLVMIRDRLGVKPLYYYPTRDGVLFGSEPKAILANPLARKIVDLDGLRGLMVLAKTPGWSLWRGMHEVEPGTVVTVDAEGIGSRTYWRLPALPHNDDQEATIERVGDLLADIVRRQLVADVPQCVLLSGGLDSSAISGLAAAHLSEQGEKLRTFSVDFPSHESSFRADAMRGTPDAPYVRDVVDFLGSAHHDVVLDPAELSDPSVRRAVIIARDMPAGLGDIDTSLYLLFKAVREQSTVALSGESADELFGGYPWFHDESARNVDTFPWLHNSPITDDHSRPLRVDLRGRLDMSSYISDQYATAVAGVQHTTDANSVEGRMRTICNLHLTRSVRMLLDRKDRMSMAVGLEVRVPFCDHRLVEYVYNTPWWLKTFDGREKSLLRHATKRILPASVIHRAKSGYPSIQDPAYAANLQQQAKEVIADPNNSAFAVLDRKWLQEAIRADSAAMSQDIRNSLDWVLDLYHWFDIYRPELLLD